MACALRLVVLLVLVAALCCLPDFTRVVWAASKLYLSHWAPVFGDAMMLVIGTMFFAVNDWDTPAARLPRILFGCGRRGQQAMWLAAGVVLCGGWTAKQLRRGVAPPLMAVFVAIKLVGWPTFQAVDLFLLWASYVRCRHARVRMPSHMKGVAGVAVHPPLHLTPVALQGAQWCGAVRMSWHHTVLTFPFHVTSACHSAFARVWTGYATYVRTLARPCRWRWHASPHRLH